MIDAHSGSSDMNSSHQPECFLLQSAPEKLLETFEPGVFDCASEPFSVDCILFEDTWQLSVQ